MTEEPEAAPAPPPASAPVVPETEYVILVQSAPGGPWTEGPSLTARGAAAAVRVAAEKGGEGTYVAVPKRSWKPVTAKSETSTKLTYS